MSNSEFEEIALGPLHVAHDPIAFIVYSKNYCRVGADGTRETYDQTIHRATEHIVSVGDLTRTEMSEVRTSVDEGVTFPSGRCLWVGGTEWSKEPANYPGLYNCSSTEIRDIESFGLVMDLSMMGCGTGAVIESDCISQLPPVHRRVTICNVKPTSGRQHGAEETVVRVSVDGSLDIRVGDSRQGWVDAFLAILRLTFGVDDFGVQPHHVAYVHIDLAEVRSAGARLEGFGGVANPAGLAEFFTTIVEIANMAEGRQLNAREVCRILDAVALVVVAGNIRRSAGLRQFDFDDVLSSNLKKDLYRSADGRMDIDRAREGMQLSAHTRVIHRRPSFSDVLRSVRSQYETGEGALEYAPEAIARCNSDLFPTRAEKENFIRVYTTSVPSADRFLLSKGITSDIERHHRLHRYGLNPCGEIIGNEFLCNLAEVHLNRLNPSDVSRQCMAFHSAGVIAAAFLSHDFLNRRYQLSRVLDPIVGVSFTGLWDFFVSAFGIGWVRWMMQGRPKGAFSFESAERYFFSLWRDSARSGVLSFCREHGLGIPSRVTTVQPAGTKSLLTGASAGWHAPKGLWYIRRVTFPAKDALALACMDCGYNVVPSLRHGVPHQSLDLWDPACTEWIVEIPQRASWAALGDENGIHLEELPAISQFGLYMAVQRYYTDHNTSGTIELREDEVEVLATRIYDAIGDGYVSVALSARLSANVKYPQMPIEPISKQKYERLMADVRLHSTSSSLQLALEAEEEINGVECHCRLIRQSSCGCAD